MNGKYRKSVKGEEGGGMRWQGDFIMPPNNLTHLRVMYILFALLPPAHNAPWYAIRLSSSPKRRPHMSRSNPFNSRQGVVSSSFACAGRGGGMGKGWMAVEEEEFGKSQLSVRLHVENLSSSCLAHKNGVKHRILPSS